MVFRVWEDHPLRLKVFTIWMNARNGTKKQTKKYLSENEKYAYISTVACVCVLSAATSSR